MKELEDAVRAAQAEYMREWRRKNKDRVRENNRKYWERKAAQKEEVTNLNTDKLFVPHELKTILVDTEKGIFRVNGEDFGKGCTGFCITCNRYDSFDIRIEIDTTVHLVSIRDGKCNAELSYETDIPQFGSEEKAPECSDEPSKPDNGRGEIG